MNILHMIFRTITVANVYQSDDVIVFFFSILFYLFLLYSISFFLLFSILFLPAVGPYIGELYERIVVKAGNRDSTVSGSSTGGE